ncbi:MAG: hypothetical protein HXX20_12805 [Chloroflexi bacterium]|nr:hypothetical protein [Chloroflexota bacterium]
MNEQAEAVLGYLSRRDKWFLGGGKAVIWAPEFPLWLDKPGFWDHACYLDYRVGPLFTLSIVDQRGREVNPRLLERSWQPDHSTQLSRDKSRDLTITERRALLPWDVLASTFEFANSLQQDQTFDLVLWTAQEREGGTRQGSSVSELEGFRVRPHDGVIISRRRVRETTAEEGVLMRFAVALGASRKATSYSVKLSDRQPNQPHWRFSPFYEKLAQHGTLGNEAPETTSPAFEGLTYFGLHYKITVPANGRVLFTAFASIASSEEEALVGLATARKEEQPVQPSAQTPPPKPAKERRPTWPARKQWVEFFEGVPSFTCSDPFLQKYYWYRWYGLRLNTVELKDERLGLHYPCVFEGVNLGWFRQHISYSAQCHMFETRWMHHPAVAQGSLLNFIENQQANGDFPGAIKNIYQGDRTLNVGVAFYHANWGQALREVHRVHPDRAFLAKIYEPLVLYLLYFDRERDPDQTGLYDVLNHWETGQEFMSRYLAVDPQAAQGGPLRLKGLDATTYIYQLQEALAWLGEQLGKPDEAGRWSAMAAKTRQAVLSLMWDSQQEYFFDLNPATMSRIAAKTPLGLYPFMTGLAGTAHLGAFYKHLFNEKEFWTPFPVPTTSLDDSTFSADGEWEGQRLVCPWNGRTWLMTNSHVAEALCQAALNLDPSLKPRAVEFMNRFIRMLFLEGDLERPSSYEYYNPFTGQAPYFRGTEDYMHSWIVDLIIKYVAGVQPGDDGQILIRPLPFKLDYFTLDRLKIAGHTLRVTWRKDEQTLTELRQATRRRSHSKLLDPEPDAPIGLTVYVDEERVLHQSNLEAVVIKL